MVDSFLDVWMSDTPVDMFGIVVSLPGPPGVDISFVVWGLVFEKTVDLS